MMQSRRRRCTLEAFERLAFQMLAVVWVCELDQVVRSLTDTLSAEVRYAVLGDYVANVTPRGHYSGALKVMQLARTHYDWMQACNVL